MEGTKIVSKLALLALTAVLAIAFFCAQVLIMIGVESVAGRKLPPVVLVGTSVPNVILALHLACRILGRGSFSPNAVWVNIRGRRYGLSPSTVVEIRARSLDREDGGVPDKKVVEAYLPRALLWFLSVVFLLAACFMGFAPMITPKGTGPAWRWITIGFCGLFSLLFVYTCFEWNQPQAKADLDGVTGYDSITPWRRFVPWTDIMTCVLLTRCNPFGEPAHYVPVFKGHDGQTLMVLNLAGVGIKDQERLVESIRERLPVDQPLTSEV